MIANLGTTRSADWTEPEHLDYQEVSPLGKYRGSTYATTPDGRELRIGSPLRPWETDNAPGRDEVRIDHLIERPNPMSKRAAPIRELEIIKATVVPPGTFARLVAGDAALEERRRRQAERATIPHRTDLATLLPQLDRVPEQAIPIGITENVERDMLGKHRSLHRSGGRPEVRGIPAIIDWLRAHGVQLATVGDQLDVRSTGMTPAIREVLDTFGPLIVGHLADKPVACALRHSRSEPAYTLAVGNLPVCVERVEADE